MAGLMILAAIVMWGGAILGLQGMGPYALVEYGNALWAGCAVLFVLGIALSNTRRKRKSRIRVDVNLRDK